MCTKRGSRTHAQCKSIYFTDVLLLSESIFFSIFSFDDEFEPRPLTHPPSKLMPRLDGSSEDITAMRIDDEAVSLVRITSVTDLYWIIANPSFLCVCARAPCMADRVGDPNTPFAFEEGLSIPNTRDGVSHDNLYPQIMVNIQTPFAAVNKIGWNWLSMSERSSAVRRLAVLPGWLTGWLMKAVDVARQPFAVIEAFECAIILRIRNRIDSVDSKTLLKR